MYEVSPAEAKAKLDAGHARLIDVREPAEWEAARIEGAELVPMGEVRQEFQRLEALAEETLLVIVCHHGVRSLRVVNWLRGQGVGNCVSLAGGIERWSTQVDAAVPRY
ncbi:MAG: hypothetical protein HY858_02250 [Candidatus Solibacter usitatus]|nr:hypothetical protein [Candidatus Solibacter usitatus]